MDWDALRLSFTLALATCAVLLPLGIWVARPLARSRSSKRWLVEAALNLPLVLPPTVLGYYLLVAMGAASPLGALYERLTGHTLAFSFEGLLLASIVFNVPFALVPMLRAFEAVPQEILQAARMCGMTPAQAFARVELPLAWPGVLSGLVMTAAHTLGEFGVVLMVGGSIPGQTKTVAIAIYDRVQAFDMRAAGMMSAFLLVVSLLALGLAARQGRSGRAF
ncbi:MULTISPECIES: molybdate ABC transporter permease subunit [Ramlibacter]|uniref:Molybdenum transport system permease n=1 Tax=Ramlibacter aquaticus TaxID=2780094 RepID=A0ABR9SCM4_9BURK|nr:MULTISPECIES: molybdate ABC transporter permease subunit [Ramlibacter]MBE7940107.1 molybdate ABC transporter permease subunit [Ramlibacter aquaticus]